jgi:hypothetical protein
VRPTRSGIVDGQAWCRQCGWSTEGKNALGNAAQHADRTSHEVQAELTRVVIYNPKPKP